MIDDRKARYRDISDGLLRQRRNLMLTSVLLPIFFLSGASVEKINILGTIILIEKPLIVKIALIILFCYFLLRYWQYYLEETYVKDMHREMHDHWYKLEQQFLYKRIRRKAAFLNQDLLNICFADPKYNNGISCSAIPKNKDKVIAPFVRRCEFYIYPDINNFDEKDEKIIVFHRVLAQPEYSNWTPVNSPLKSSPQFYKEYINYNVVQVAIMRLIGATQYMLNQSYFTDYQLPYVLAFSSVVTTLYAIFI